MRARALRHGLEGVDWKRIEEFVGDYERGLVCFYGFRVSVYELSLREVMGCVPFGRNLMSSTHTTFAPGSRLLTHCLPLGWSCRGKSPQSSCFCISLRVGLASIRYKFSIALAIGLKFAMVYHSPSVLRLPQIHS